MHEIAHWQTYEGLSKESPYYKFQSAHEVIAEGIAYVVCDYFGLDTEQYAVPYIALWDKVNTKSDVIPTLDLCLKYISIESGKLIKDLEETFGE